MSRINPGILAAPSCPSTSAGNEQAFSFLLLPFDAVQSVWLRAQHKVTMISLQKKTVIFLAWKMSTTSLITKKY
ncbi:MAG: hypothetical protein IIB76_01440 [Proteobacteria bacterium]|nr:hypothetical protein [Pseudomonadota bacterium]